MDSLPPELVAMIFEHLPKKSRKLRAAGSVSRQFREICKFQLRHEKHRYEGNSYQLRVLSDICNYATLSHIEILRVEDLFIPKFEARSYKFVECDVKNFDEKISETVERLSLNDCAFTSLDVSRFQQLKFLSIAAGKNAAPKIYGIESLKFLEVLRLVNVEPENLIQILGLENLKIISFRNVGKINCKTLRIGKNVIKLCIDGTTVIRAEKIETFSNLKIVRVTVASLNLVEYFNSLNLAHYKITLLK